MIRNDTTVPQSPRPIGLDWRVWLLFTALTLFFTFPLWLHPATRVLGVDNDTDLSAWLLAWDAHAFTHQPLSLFDANIYYPERHTLAYAENLIGSAALVAPVIWTTGNPLLGMNLVSLFSCLLCGIGAFVLARRLGIGKAGAIVAGMIFAFSPPRFFRIGQLHLTAVQWVPFGLASLHAYLDGRRRRDLRIATAFFTLQVLTSGHGGTFLAIAMLALVAYRLALGERIGPVRAVRDFGFIGALLLLPAILMFLPYQAVQQEIGLRRTLADWVVSGWSFVHSPTYLHQFLIALVPGLEINQRARASLFPGILPLLLAVFAFLRFRSTSAERLAGSDRLRRGYGGPPKRGAKAEDPASIPTTARPEAWSLEPGSAIRPGRSWRALALLADLLAIAGLAIGVRVLVDGPVKLRVGAAVLLSSRSAWRPLLLAAVAIAARVALLRRVPLPRLHPDGGWLGAASRLVGRARATRERLRQNAAAFYALLTLATVLLAAPRPIAVWPYLYQLPGLSFIRVPSRITILGVLGIAVLAGLGFDRLFGRLKPATRRVGAVLVGVLLAAEFVAIPLRVQQYRIEIPAIDRWLDSQPKPFAVAEVPLLRLETAESVARYDRRHSMFMLHSMAHWQKTVHGYSGIRPPLHEQLYFELESFPDETSLRSLARLEVTYLVVHTDLYPPGEWPAIDAGIARFPQWLRLLHAEGAGRVYALLPQPPAPSTRPPAASLRPPALSP